MSDLERLHDASYNGDADEVVKILNENPALINAKSSEGDTALHMACWGKQIGLIGILVHRGADVNSVGWQGFTPLHYAVHEGGAISVPLVCVLMQDGADPNIRDKKGFAPRDWAKIEMDVGLTEVLKYLEKPVDIQAERVKILALLDKLIRNHGNSE